jgi:hypothetical protein
MKDLLNFFDKPKDPLSFDAVRISIASPEMIRSGRTVKLRSLRPSTTGHSSQKEMVFFAQRSLVQ